MTIEAGVTLKAAQIAAAEAGCLLPLSISSEGSAQIGGVLAANAGGNNTVRYGNARDLVLGLEVVLPDGTIWNGLRRLRKDNTGYCLRQLFVGSEGTLGVITAAVLKLAPRPREIAVAFCAVASPEAALKLFARFQSHDAGGDQRVRADVGPRHRVRAAAYRGRRRCRWPRPAPFYVLVELATPRPDAGLRDALETVLEEALGDGVVIRTPPSRNRGAARGDLAAARGTLRGAETRRRQREERRFGAGSKVPEFIRRATAACEALMPGIRAVPFGHMGDGNIHFNLEQPVDADPAWFLAQDHAIMDTVNEVVREFDGSFSAEHGIGKLKPYMMPDWRGGAELAVMQRIKAALDPLGS